MDILENYTNNLLIFLEEKLGARFNGYCFVDKDMGYITGFIDDIRIDIRCYDLIVTYEFNDHNANALRDELDLLIREYIGNDDIKTHAEIHSYASNTLGSIFLLNHRIVEEQKKRR